MAGESKQAQWVDGRLPTPLPAMMANTGINMCDRQKTTVSGTSRSTLAERL